MVRPRRLRGCLCRTRRSKRFGKEDGGRPRVVPPRSHAATARYPSEVIRLPARTNSANVDTSAMAALAPGEVPLGKPVGATFHAAREFPLKRFRGNAES